VSDLRPPADECTRDFPPLNRELPFAPDPVIEAYKKDVDRTLIRENLRRSPAERLRNLQAWQRFAAEWKRALGSARRV
jgi:hypothetical protein